MFPSSLKPETINRLCQNSLVSHLEIVFTKIEREYIEAEMPVNAQTRQPYGLLHGGASVVLAETMGSVASGQLVAPDQMVVGLHVEANHIRAKKEGKVTGRVSAIHLGRRTHVWEIRITDETGRLIAISKLTVAIIEKVEKHGT